MPLDQERKGPMDESYARGRRADAAISYRYRIRAGVAARAINRNLNPRRPLQILDLGSADGTTLAEMARFLPPRTAFTGIEYSAALASLAAHLSPNIHVVRGDIEDLPAAVKHRRFDAVTALAVLEHLPRPVSTLRDAAHLLKPGGIMVVTCPEPSWDILATRLGLLEDHHESHLSRRIMDSCLAQAELELIEYQRFMWAPVAVLPYLKIRVPPALSLALDQSIRRPRFLNWLFVNQLWVARKV